MAETEPLICALDVDYRGAIAVAACVGFRGWTAAAPLFETVAVVRDIAPYRAGQFYRRELKCLLKVLETAETTPDVVVVDGYVWLDADTRPGLGAHLYKAMRKRVAVIGVAKSRYLGAIFRSLLRGHSRSPLHITAVGMDDAEAVECIRRMHGPFRIPTLLKRADQLSRTAQI